MSLIQLIYTSRPFGYDAATLSGLLLDARRKNAQAGITGALICRQDIYIQFLEGPAEAVQATYARIQKDDRHVAVMLRLSETIAKRLFPDWAMLHDPEHSWHWSSDELRAGALQRATADDFRAIFAKLAECAREDTQGGEATA